MIDARLRELANAAAKGDVAARAQLDRHLERTMLRRELLVEVRKIDVEKRTATFVAATEAAVPMWGGPEVLRMSGLDKRALKTGVVLLDAHDRSSVSCVIGRAALSIEGKQLIAECTYAGTARGEEAWQLVRDGFVRAMSIGYFVDPRKVKRLLDGEVDGRGDEEKVTGPCSIVRGWQVFEVSNVPIGADQDAVRRSFYEAIHQNNPAGAGQEEDVQLSDVINNQQRATGDQPAGATPPPPAPAPGKGTSSISPGDGLIPEERAARARAAVDGQIRSLAQAPHLKAVGERCVLEGLDLEASRKRLLEEHARAFPPLGTPEPAPAPKSGATTTGSATPNAGDAAANDIRSMVAKATGQKA